MDKVIQEGSLRLNLAESCCDVVLCCQGHRLMAHKLILSIASPVLMELLREDASEASVIILPDINASTMSLILDYIYTGNALVCFSMIQDFLSTAYLLQIKLSISEKDIYKNCKTNLLPKHKVQEDCETKEIRNNPDYKEDTFLPKSSETIIYSKRNQKRIPDLVPLRQKCEKRKSKRKLCDLVIPSPWCPRIDRPVLGDPRDEYLGATDSQIHSPNRLKPEENDSNNNLPFTSLQPLPRYIPNRLNDAIKNIYLNSTEKKTYTASETDLLPQNYTKTAFESQAPNVSNLFQNQTRVKEKEKIVCKDFSKKYEHFLQNTYETKSSFIKTSLSSSTSSANALRTTTNQPPEESCSTENETQRLAEKASTVVNDANRQIKDNLSNNVNNDSCDDKVNVVDVVVNKQGVHKNKPFRCEDCGKCFSQHRNFKYHRSLHEGTKEFSANCQECGKVFNDRGYLSSHMKIHRDKKEYACPHCPKRFNQRVAYNMHFRIHTGVKPHECPTCGKSFSRKMLLKQHQRVHTGERPYSCPECGKTFADRSNMSLHARLHTGIKPYACNLCPKSFTKKHHLKTHMNFHTGLKPYSCEKCGLSFSQSSNMRTHYKKCILKQVGSGNKSP